jgi:uncharacterized membrane protein
MMSSQPRPTLEKNGIYRTIRTLFWVDLIIGLALAAAGYWIWNRPGVWIFGLGLAAVGVVMLGVFSMLLRRASGDGRNISGS